MKMKVSIKMLKGFNIRNKKWKKQWDYFVIFAYTKILIGFEKYELFQNL